MFKSKAQRDFCLAQVKAGKISQATFDKWEAETDQELPSRVAKPSQKSAVKPIKKAKIIK